jgi:branched-chain amino acid transport system substrate-binding protein
VKIRRKKEKLYMRIRALLLTVFVIASLALAACAPAPQPAAPAEETAAAADATAAEATAEATEAAAEEAATEEAAAAPAEGGCTDPLGCIEVAAGDPIKIGYALVTAGPNASLGEDSVRGIEIAVDDLGGEILGHPIEIVGEDTGCSPEGGQAAATKLASDTSLVAVVGTSCSSEARVGAPILAEAGLSMISPSNTAPDLTDPEKHIDGYFRTAHNDLVQGRVAAEFVFNSLGLTKAATIHDGSLYAVGLATAFADAFKELGGEIVSEQAVNVGDTDMRPVLTTIAAAGPEFIFYPIFTAEAGFVTAQAKEVPGLEDVKLGAADGSFSQDFVNAAGDAALGMYLSSPDFGAFGDQYQGFLTKHEEKFGEPPLSAFHAHAYDATNMIAAAIQQVATQDGDTLIIGKQALRDAIAGTTDFQGLTGNITCGETGDCADPKIAVYEVTDTAEWNPNVTSPMKVFPE